MQFKEDFLHFIWKFRLYNTVAFRCEPFGKFQIINTGLSNHHAGPDFLGAKLKIDETTWVGHVEIHVSSSDWLQHKHQHDQAYDNVILHVVYEHDQKIYRKNGTEIPVFILKGLFDEALYQNYNALIHATHFFPCEKQIDKVERIIVNGFLSRQLIERFEHKTSAIQAQLHLYKGDWEKTLYYFIARNFGFKINATPFELIAASLDLHVIKRYHDDPLKIEALLYGQAGFLNQGFDEPYPLRLKKEYLFLQHKHQLSPIDISLWKFLRMRPQNFPTIRLAQFAALMSCHAALFDKVLEIEQVDGYYAIFKNLPVHSYWNQHYHFNKKTTQVSIQVGKVSIENILINTICVFLYVYGKYTDQQKYIDKNSIVDKYKSAGISFESAFASQAVLQLNKFYCSQKKCLNCSIGIKILNK
jgi:hypothetical protein